MIATTPITEAGTDEAKTVGAKSKLELLIDEVGKTHDRIQKLQTGLENLRNLMGQEYANFHNALHDEKQQTEILKDRIENEESMCQAKNEKLRQQLENTEKRVSYQMNALAVDIKDEIGNLNLSMLAIDKLKRIHSNFYPAEESHVVNSSVITQVTMSGAQVLTDFSLWMFTCILHPVTNFVGLIQVLFMITIVSHVFSFVTCNVACSNQGFNLFTVADDIRDHLRTQNQFSGKNFII